MLPGWKRGPDPAWLIEPSKGPLQAALRHLQPAFDAFWGKQKGSNNRAKARVKVARIQARVGDRRRDHLRKLTTRLVR